jgi:hypothetical protein
MLARIYACDNVIREMNPHSVTLAARFMSFNVSTLTALMRDDLAIPVDE